MPLDGAGAEEEPGRYLGVGEAVSGEPCDLRLLGCEHIAGFGRPSARLLAGGQPLAVGALGERPHRHDSEHLVSGMQLLASRSAAAGSAKPLAVEQVRAGKLRALPRTAQSLNRLVVKGLNAGALAQQCAASGIDAEPEVAARGLCRLHE